MHRNQYHNSSNLGMTLIELVVVVGIIGALVAMLMPAIQLVREASRRAVCANNAKQVALALHSFEAAHKYLPPPLHFNRPFPLMHWHVSVLPYLEQSNLYHEVANDFANDVHPYHQVNMRTNVPAFQCVSNVDSGKLLLTEKTGVTFSFSDYCGVSGIDSVHSSNGVFPRKVFDKDRGTGFQEIKDGLSNTLMFGERPPSVYKHGYGMWLGSQSTNAATIGVRETTSTDEILTSCEELGFQKGARGDDCSTFHHWSYHPTGANFAYADASVHFLPYSFEKAALEALASIAGGEVESH